MIQIIHERHGYSCLTYMFQIQTLPIHNHHHVLRQVAEATESSGYDYRGSLVRTAFHFDLSSPDPERIMVKPGLVQPYGDTSYDLMKSRGKDLGSNQSLINQRANYGVRL